MTGAIVATSIVFFPAAPLFLFIKGKDITIPQGTEITAFVEGDMHLNMANFVPAPPPPALTAPPVPAAAVQASLVIDSTPPGADIEIDGAFVGNTPSTVGVEPGSHQIAVKKKGFTDWSKTLSVTEGQFTSARNWSKHQVNSGSPKPGRALIQTLLRPGSYRRSALVDVCHASCSSLRKCLLAYPGPRAHDGLASPTDFGQL